MKPIHLLLIILPHISPLKLNDPLGNLLKSLYRETPDGFEIEFEPFLNIKYKSGSKLLKNGYVRPSANLLNATGLSEDMKNFVDEKNYDSVTIEYGNGKFNLFDRKEDVMNQAVIGWGEISGVYQLNWNHTGRIDVFPDFGFLRGNSRNGNSNETLKMEKEVDKVDTAYTHLDNHFKLHLDLPKRAIGFKSTKTILVPDNPSTHPAISMTTSLNLGLSNIRYSQKGIEVIVRSDLDMKKTDQFPDLHFVKYLNFIPDHLSTLFLTVRIGHTCMGQDAVFTKGCRSIVVGF